MPSIAVFRDSGCCRIAIHKRFLCVYGGGACSGGEVVVIVVVVVVIVVVYWWWCSGCVGGGDSLSLSGSCNS